jgi:RNA polymerase sigma-70 factor, ECF subfamily
LDEATTADYVAVQMAGSDDSYVPPPGQAEIVAALRAGDERAFALLVEELGPSLLRVARMYVSTTAVAEEVVQETWLGVLAGIERFEGRSSLKTWIFRILTNRAKTRGEREGRSVPFSSLAVEGNDDDRDGATVAADRFQGSGRYAGHWTSAPSRWSELPESRLVAKETVGVAQAAIDALPEAQRAVITMRDVEGWSSEEVRNVLGLSESNQRVLLHRARAKVRRALESYLEGDRP